MIPVVQGPILAFVYAVKEMIEESRDTGGSLPVNVAFAFEGEEENGSGGFREAIKANLHWFEGTQLIIISNTLWVGEEVCVLISTETVCAVSVLYISYSSGRLLGFLEAIRTALGL